MKALQREIARCRRERWVGEGCLGPFLHLLLEKQARDELPGDPRHPWQWDFVEPGSSGPVSPPRCRVRVIDTFGTEPAYNHEEYATLRGYRTNWGYWNLQPTQFMTMFRKWGMAGRFRGLASFRAMPSSPALLLLLPACKELPNPLGHLLAFRSVPERGTWLLPPRWVAGCSRARAKRRAQPGVSSSWEGKREAVLVAKPGLISAGISEARGSSVVQTCLWHGKEMCLSERSLVTRWALGDSNIAFSWLDKTHLAAFKMPYFLNSCSSSQACIL